MDGWLRVPSLRRRRDLQPDSSAHFEGQFPSSASPGNILQPIWATSIYIERQLVQPSSRDEQKVDARISNPSRTLSTILHPNKASPKPRNFSPHINRDTAQLQIASRLHL